MGNAYFWVTFLTTLVLTYHFFMHLDGGGHADD